ncbi:MAG: spoVD [Candidatus Saganbacteria bacterium]|uniref:SpoVD n=1 Tax=Candidatus Saganbacteria bacterium TaxID=2575572 RepID=A0A833L0M8_UNCSA|nr:MAG: spoVD [Candidatus Saganbacteria bacterium]
MKRDRIILAVFFILASMIFIRLFEMQVIHYKFYRGKAERQRKRIINLAADRGDILDRNGRILATSIDTTSIYVNPREFTNVKELSALLKEAVGPFDKKKLFAWVKRKIDPSLGRIIEEKKLKGVYFLNEKKRVYPKGHFASQLIGFVGIDNEGLSGIELSCDRYLKGVEGRIVTESDPMGYELLSVKDKNVLEAAPGSNLTLTIDETIQYYAEREIEKAVKNYNAVSGLALVMDAKTGEILALAGKPDFDPNEYSKFDPMRWKSSVIDAYEPGSTFKVITAAAGLDEGVINLETKLNALDSLTIGGKVIKNSHDINWKGKFISVSWMLEQSINTGAAQISIKLGPDKFYKKIKDFGFGEPTLIGLQGESRGLLREPKDWYKPDIAMIAFGQSIAVTPLQMVSAFSGIANDGKRVRPFLIKKIESQDLSTLKTFTAEELNRAISKKTAQDMIKLLENVVLLGSGRKTKMSDYRVGGKTGTAQKAGQGGYLKGRYIASFIGIAPLSDPKLIAMVIVNEPRGCIWGETVAGPTFKNIVEASLRYLNVPPDMVKSANKP